MPYAIRYALAGAATAFLMALSIHPLLSFTAEAGQALLTITSNP